jgi:hypothetical protein
MKITTVVTRHPFVIVVALFLGLCFGLVPARAQQAGPVQVLNGRIEDNAVAYQLPDMKKGDTLYLYAGGTSQNFDPFVAVADSSLQLVGLRDRFYSSVDAAITAGSDPLEVVPEFADATFLAWDDDSGSGHDAATQLLIPADGDYQLLVFSTPAPKTFGDFRLLVGINTPAVLTGQAEPTGEAIAIPWTPNNQAEFTATQELTGTLTTGKSNTFYTFTDLNAGDTVYARAEATSNDLVPVLILRDYGNKPLASANFTGQESTALLEYTIVEGGSNYRLRLEACCADNPTSGDYRLLVGINNPDVLDGQATPGLIPVVKEPIEVKVGIIMEQITGIDQKSENFGVVVDLRMEWTDPALAFNPDDCECFFQTFGMSGFEKYMAEKGVQAWPDFTLFNQQGRRDSQAQTIVVSSNGNVIYYERFSATLQAPDFNFERFPFDAQQFYIRVKAVFPAEFFVFTDLETHTGLGAQLGEEEWVIHSPETIVDSHNNSSRFSFGFSAYRHLNFYIFRIFLPVVIIIIVSWFTFFLKDYGKRVDVASANLLLFIAFNFTISDDLPRLGYLTLMDTILVSTFVVTALVIVFNVYLKRLEVNGKQNFANTVDQYMIWLYPLAYVIAIGGVTFFFG